MASSGRQHIFLSHSARSYDLAWVCARPKDQAVQVALVAPPSEDVYAHTLEALSFGFGVFAQVPVTKRPRRGSKVCDLPSLWAKSMVNLFEI